MLRIWQKLPTPTGAQPEAWVCRHSLLRIVGLNPARVMDVFIL